MSRKQLIETRCPNCDGMVKSTIWQSINVQIDPEAKEELLCGRINVARCPSCKTDYPILIDLLYHDMENNLCVQFFPFQKTNEESFLDQFTEEARLDTGLGMLGVDTPEYFKDFHYVFSMTELARYILFRDRLAQRKANINNGNPACFSCGGNIPRDELMYTVTRLRRERCGKDRTDDEVIDAISSIQVCQECTARAGVERIEIKERPIPLLNIEVDHFHHFAAWLTDKTKELKSVSPGSYKCFLCDVETEDDKYYTQLDVAEEVHTANGVEIKNEYTLSILCDGCATKYLVWL